MEYCLPPPPATTPWKAERSQNRTSFPKSLWACLACQGLHVLAHHEAHAERQRGWLEHSWCRSLTEGVAKNELKEQPTQVCSILAASGWQHSSDRGFWTSSFLTVAQNTDALLMSIHHPRDATRLVGHGYRHWDFARALQRAD